MTDVRTQFGVDVLPVSGPFEAKAAERVGDGSDGGVLDNGLVGRLPDGRRVVFGELWAAGLAEDGARVSIDVAGLTDRIVHDLNAAPELLSALRACRHALVTWMGYVTDDLEREDRKAWQWVVEKADAAIAEATTTSETQLAELRDHLAGELRRRGEL